FQAGVLRQANFEGGVAPVYRGFWSELLQGAPIEREPVPNAEQYYVLNVENKKLLLRRCRGYYFVMEIANSRSLPDTTLFQHLQIRQARGAAAANQATVEVTAQIGLSILPFGMSLYHALEGNWEQAQQEAVWDGLLLAAGAVGKGARLL